MGRKGVAQQVRARAIGDPGRPKVAVNQQRDAADVEATSVPVQEERWFGIVAVGKISQERVGGWSVDGQSVEPPPTLNPRLPPSTPDAPAACRRRYGRRLCLGAPPAAHRPPPFAANHAAQALSPSPREERSL